MTALNNELVFFNRCNDLAKERDEEKALREQLQKELEALKISTEEIKAQVA